MSSFRRLGDSFRRSKAINISVIFVLVPVVIAWGAGRPPSIRTSSIKSGAASANQQCIEVTNILGSNADLLTASQTALATSLIELDQKHIFEDWPAFGEDDENKRRLLSQLDKLDETYPGGLSKYISRGRTLLAEAAAGENPLKGFEPSVPSGEELSFGDEEFRSMEMLGSDAVCRTAFVLVAGGLGERLGYSGIKLSLPVESCTSSSFFKMYADWILNIQKKCAPEVELPFAIMTSGDTDEATRRVLEKENYFGLNPDQVTVILQEKVPALSDSQAHLAMEKDDRWSVITKPHGHGDVHQLLLQSGLARSWADSGKEWAFFFQDTNPLVVHALLPMLGVSVDKGYVMNSLCVPRKAQEAAGAITTLNNPTTGETYTINVEYNQLDPLLRSTPQFKEGDVNDPRTGFSPFPGNVNNLLVHIPTYADVLEGEDQGVVEEFVNPKYADASRNTFKKPTRLECMMQDLPKLLTKELGPSVNVGFTTMERWLTFSPAKNAPEPGAGGTPSTAEADISEANSKTLELVSGVKVERSDEPQVMRGVSVNLLPSIVMHTNFALTAVRFNS